MTDASAAYPEGVASAVTYCRDVLSGAIAACRLVQLTCARFLSDLEAAESETAPGHSVRIWPSAQ